MGKWACAKLGGQTRQAARALGCEGVMALDQPPIAPEWAGGSSAWHLGGLLSRCSALGSPKHPLGFWSFSRKDIEASGLGPPSFWSLALAPVATVG